MLIAGGFIDEKINKSSSDCFHFPIEISNVISWESEERQEMLKLTEEWKCTWKTQPNELQLTYQCGMYIFTLLGNAEFLKVVSFTLLPTVCNNIFCSWSLLTLAVIKHFNEKWFLVSSISDFIIFNKIECLLIYIFCPFLLPIFFSLHL